MKRVVLSLHRNILEQFLEWKRDYAHPAEPTFMCLLWSYVTKFFMLLAPVEKKGSLVFVVMVMIGAKNAIFCCLWLENYVLLTLCYKNEAVVGYFKLLLGSPTSLFRSC